VAGESWLGGYFKGCFVRGSMREVCAGGEDILLSEGDGKSKSKVSRPCVLRERSERELGREMPKRKSRFQQKYQKIGPSNNGGRGLKTGPYINIFLF
jgi:hypothetical protein